MWMFRIFHMQGLLSNDFYKFDQKNRHTKFIKHKVVMRVERKLEYNVVIRWEVMFEAAMLGPVNK